ncbi:glycine cleavage system protein T [Halobacteriales archaeon QS_1_68_17]|nr:MAG: glycine cleavage system protein T [Halobacteriales archaeon QS_1_68_17]
MVVDGRPPGETHTVVVGAGIVGCSAAYHLSRHTDAAVAVVDQGPIPETGGSTLHAPGGLRQSNENRTMARLARYSRDLYADLGAFDAAGSIEVARSRRQWEYIKRKYDHSTAYGIEGPELLSPAEVGEYSDLVDTDALVGGYYVPGDGQIRTLQLLDALIEAAEARNVTFHEHTELTDIETAGGGVDAVVTDRGRIDCERVLVATNIWSPLVGEMVDVDVPLVPCEHQYVVTEALPELAGATTETESPGIRHQEASLYVHQHGEGIGIGSYDHRARLLDPESIPDHDDAIEHPLLNGYAVGADHDRTRSYRMPATRPFTESDFESAWAEATDLFPALAGADLDRSFNGVFSFSVDGMPILGETPDVADLWVAAAIWITHAGGAGKVVADWMARGTTDLPSYGCSIDRFQPHAGTDAFVAARGRENYETVYDVSHPREPSASERRLRRSPFYDRQDDLGAAFYDADGWERPRWYGSNESLLDEYGDRIPDREGWTAEHWSPIEGAEHLAVRDRGGLFDVSSLTPLDIDGPDALATVQRTFTSDLDVPVGRVTYTTMVDAGGGILGDMPVVRLAEDRFRAVASAGADGATQKRVLRERVPGGARATVTDRTSGLSGVAVWGPRARDTFASLTDADLSADGFPAFTAREVAVGSVPALAMRLSYAGEDGWELHVPTEYAAELWDRLEDAGRERGLVPMGTGALDTTRLEAGRRLYGADIRSEYTPYEAGLGWTVDLDTDFVGSEALADADDPARRLTALTLDDPGEVVVAGMPIFDGDRRLGYATSAGYGYSVGRCIVYGYLPADVADPGTSLDVRYQAERYPATVRREPLYDPDSGRE